jgi:hypothetical protein
MYKDSKLSDFYAQLAYKFDEEMPVLQKGFEKEEVIYGK